MNSLTLTQQLTSLIDSKPITAADLEQSALFTLDALANALADKIDAQQCQAGGLGYCQQSSRRDLKHIVYCTNVSGPSIE